MTEKETLAILEENEKRIDSMKEEIWILETDSKTILDKFINEESKFKVGDAVNIIGEKYNKPRKYFVKDVWGFVGSQNNVNKIMIYYCIETANGYKPNSGYSLEEDKLKLAE